MSENKCQGNYHLRQCLRGDAVVALDLDIVFIGSVDGDINSQQMKCVTDEKAGKVVNHAGNRAGVQSD